MPLDMKPQERKLLILLGLLAVVVLVVRVVPLVADWYTRGQEDIALLQERIERYEQLIADTEVWKERELLKQAEVAEYANWVFQGNNPSLLGPSLQRSLRQTAEQAGITVREMKVARFARVDDWLVVTQEMDFVLDQQNILPFLNALAEQRPRLFVTAFTMAHNRRQFSGNITVTGFSRATALTPATTEGLQP